MAWAQSPFTVTPRIELHEGARTLKVSFGVPTNHVLYAEKLAFRLADGAEPLAFQLPEPQTIKDRFSGKEKKVFMQSFEAIYPLTNSLQSILKLTVHFQGCDEANCFFPEDQIFSISPGGSIARLDEPNSETKTVVSGEWQAVAAGFVVANRGSGYLSEKEFLGFLDQSKAVAAAGAGASGFWGVLLTMGLIVLGGAALNLTPCILPMIPINLAIIGAGAQAGSKKRGFALGATYAAGMAIAYGVLGLVVVLTGSKFGTLNSSPWFNLGIASVFLFLALAMFDLVSVDLSRFQTGSAGGNSSSRSKFIVAYTMGTVAALLAGACVAPVVISVLLQATTLHAKGVTVGLLLPFLLGLGMGLPWPFAGAGLSFLPKPGRWMMRVKYGFGVLIILFGLYYGHLAYGLFRTDARICRASPWPRRQRRQRQIHRGTRQCPQGLEGGWQTRVRRFLGELVQELFGDGAYHLRGGCGQEPAGGLSRSPIAGRASQSVASERSPRSFQVIGLPSYVLLTPKARQRCGNSKRFVSAQK